MSGMISIQHNYVYSLVIFNSSMKLISYMRNFPLLVDEFKLFDENGNKQFIHSFASESTPVWIVASSMAPNGIDVWIGGGVATTAIETHSG